MGVRHRMATAESHTSKTGAATERPDGTPTPSKADGTATGRRRYAQVGFLAASVEVQGQRPKHGIAGVILFSGRLITSSGKARLCGPKKCKYQRNEESAQPAAAVDGGKAVRLQSNAIGPPPLSSSLGRKASRPLQALVMFGHADGLANRIVPVSFLL